MFRPIAPAAGKVATPGARPGVYKPIQPKMAAPAVYKPHAFVPRPVPSQNVIAAHTAVQKLSGPPGQRRSDVNPSVVSSRSTGIFLPGRLPAAQTIQPVANPGAYTKPGVIQPLIVYLSDDPTRFQRMEIIKKLFGSHEAKALRMLTKDCLKKPKPGFLGSLFSTPAKEALIVNGHGNEDEIGTLTPENLFNQLLNAGLNDNDYDRVILISCDVGKGYDNFANDFRAKIIQTPATAGIQVFAPIGKPGYQIVMKPHEKDATLQVVDLENSGMYVKADYGSGVEKRAVTLGGGGGGFRLVTT